MPFYKTPFRVRSDEVTSNCPVKRRDHVENTLPEQGPNQKGNLPYGRVGDKYFEQLPYTLAALQCFLTTTRVQDTVDTKTCMTLGYDLDCEDPHNRYP